MVTEAKVERWMRVLGEVDRGSIRSALTAKFGDLSESLLRFAESVWKQVVQEGKEEANPGLRKRWLVVCPGGRNQQVLGRIQSETEDHWVLADGEVYPKVRREASPGTRAVILVAVGGDLPEACVHKGTPPNVIKEGNEGRTWYCAIDEAPE